MKKLVGGMLVALSLCAMAEEQKMPKITWGAWGRALYAPLNGNNGGEVVPKETASWGYNSRIGFTVKGESELIGFQVDMKADEFKIEANDQQKIWVKPFENVKLELGGNVYYDALRGNAVYGAWNWVRPAGIAGEDSIFARAHVGRENHQYTVNAQGGSVISYNKDGLTLFAAHDYKEDMSAGKEIYTSAIMMARGQYGMGYDIDGLGTARIQYIGRSYDKGAADELESYGIINAALKIDQSIENLYVDLGVFLPTDDDNKNGDNTRVIGYANYKLSDATTTHFSAEAEFDKVDANGDEEMGLKIGFGADINLDGGYTVNADLRYHNETAVAIKDVDNQVAVLVGIQKFVGNGLVGIGVQGTTHQFNEAIAKEDIDDFAWAIPVKLEYWF